MRGGIAKNQIILRVAARQKGVYQNTLQLGVRFNFAALNFVKKRREILIELIVPFVHCAQRKPDGIYLEQKAHRVAERRYAHMPRVLGCAGIIRIFKPVQQRNVKMSDKTDGAARMRQ